MKNIYKIIFILFFQSTTINQQSFAQTAPGIEWQNTIGGNAGDNLLTIQQTTDGGYILGGFSYSDISGDKSENSIGSADYWIIKTDSFGNIQWQNTIGGSGSDVLHSIQQTADGGYILGGYSQSNISGDKTENSWNNSNDYWLIKTDAFGNIQWQNTIGGSDEDALYSIHQTVDAGYVFGGSSRSNISGDKTENNWGIPAFTGDYWIVKVDAIGIIQSQNTIGGTAFDELLSIQQTFDGGYILGGFSDSNISGDKTENSNGGLDYWIIKIDISGNLQWQNSIGGSDNDGLYSIQQTSDEGYILGGYSWSNISGDKTENCIGVDDYWLVKIDASGNIQWQNTIGGSDDDFLRSIQQTGDGGYILGGYSWSNISGDKTENSIGFGDYWIVKTDSTGNIQWQKTLGGSATDALTSVQQTADGGYILGGRSQSNISGDKTENCIGDWDYWIIKLAPDTITSISDSPLERGKGCVIFPNPLTAQSILTFSNPHKEKFLFTLYDITGRVTETVSTATEQIILNKGSKQAGVYLFHLDKLGVTNNEKTGERVNGKIAVGN